MSFPTIYLSFPGNARDALTYYQGVFGGDLRLFTYAEFSREDGPADAVAHGELSGPVALSASDGADAPPSVHGLMLTVLGLEPATQRAWFRALAADGTVEDDLQKRPWGDYDGQVTDRFGLRWLIGFKGDLPDSDEAVASTDSNTAAT